MSRILIIEDDAAIAKIEQDFLTINGYETHIEEDGVKGLQEALKGEYDLILLDLMLPGMDGLDICRQLRDVLDIPILMVTARTEDLDKLMGLGLGADDYISKPFSPTELVARVKANLAQYQRIRKRSAPTPAEKTDTLELGDVTLHKQSRRVYLCGKEIECKNKEFELLFFLMSNPDIVFDRETLYERVWGLDAMGDSRTVAVHVNRLREKIEKNPAEPAHLQTVWGAGYRFKP